MTQPRRLPEKIYVRRRVAALVILLVVIALIVWGLTAWGRSAGGDNPETDNAAAPTTTSITPATPTVQVGGSSTESTTSESESSAEETTKSEESTEPDAKAEGKDSCEVGDLQIAASTDKPDYGQGEQPVFYMTVKNPTAVDCELTLKADTLRFEVYNMGSNERMWADTDCYESVITGDQVFPAGEERILEAVWSRTGSSPGQCANRQAVPAGAYFLHGVIENNASDAAPFNLRD